MAAADNSDLKITDLNNDCLTKIFSHLNYTDLINVNEAYGDFNGAVVAVCRLKSFKLKIILKDDAEFLENILPVEKFLLLFGDKMQKSSFEIFIDLYWRNYNESVLKRLGSLFGNRCTVSNITHISLNNLHIDETSFTKHEKFFASLKSLIIQFDWTLKWKRSPSVSLSYGWLFNFLPRSRLEEFKFLGFNEARFGGVCNYNLLAKIATSQLKRCFIAPISLVRDTSTDVPENHTLKQLGLKGVYFDATVLEKFPQIEHLSIFVFNEDYFLLPIANLNNLRYLNLNVLLNFPHLNVFLKELAQKNKLESLTLSIRRSWTGINHNGLQLSEIENEMASSLCRMTNLKKLKLETYLDLRRHFPKIGRSLANLKTFHYRKLFVDYTDDDIDRYLYLGDYFNMSLEFVEAAKNLNSLVLNPSPCNQHFYNKLVEIRRAQGNPETLLVNEGYPNHFIASNSTTRFVNSSKLKAPEEYNFEKHMGYLWHN